MTAEPTSRSTAADDHQNRTRICWLDRRTALYLATLLIPLAGYGIVLKIIRMSRRGLPGPLEWLDQLSSDLMFGAGFGLAWLVIIATIGRRTPARPIAFMIMHLSAIVVAAVSTGFHVYFQRTGSPLTLERLISALGSAGEISGLVAAEIRPEVVLLLIGAVGYAIAGPAVITRLIIGRGPARAGRATGRPLIPVAALTTALLLGSCYSGPSSPSYFSRAPVLAVGLSGLEDSAATKPRDLPEPATIVPPTDTGLTAGPKTQRRNVVIITLESQRAISTAPYTDDLAITPNLAALAESSLVAEQAYAVMPHTSKSLTATYCGVEPPMDTQNSEAGGDGTGGRGVAARCLPELLGQQDYRSAFFQSATESYDRRRDVITGQFGFDEFYGLEDLPKEGFSEANYFGYEDDVMLQPSREWIERNRKNPFLLGYLTVTAHHDYKLPDGFETEHLSDDPELNDYLNGLRYQDRFVGQVIQQFKELGLYDDTVFVITGDHGEGFGEHDLRQHDNTIYQEGVQVPLIIHDPQRAGGGQRVTTPVQHPAILPTVTDLLGYRISTGTGGGYRSPSLLSKASRPPVMISCFEEARCLARIEGTRKYIHHYDFRPDEVFDLAADPGETTNLAASTPPEDLARYRAEALQWRRQVDRLYTDLRTPTPTPR
ncbi:LTA synthase family protein [Microlunatus speluncae]|uniref:LTA synthase family protein n=1 Tax=Microlunatus speluncae TaxID=2594267 RepID=UPI0012667491|nr:sulfatase-like hydrolase/transferase [Microlunatus speluncae]